MAKKVETQKDSNTVVTVNVSQTLVVLQSLYS